MAKVYGASIEKFFIFFVIIGLSFCVSAEVEEYRYDVLSDLPVIRDASYQSITPLRQKRDTADSLKTQYKSVTESPTIVTESTTPVSTPVSNSSTTVQTTVKQEPPGQTATSQTVSPTPSKVVPYLTTNNQPLVGVNGTGQRKNYTNVGIPLKPAVVSEPIQPATKKPLLSGKAPNATLPVIGEDDTSILETIDVPEDETLKQLENRNYTVNQTTDHHLYYNSTIFVSKDLADVYWNSFKNISPNTMLSTSHRRAMTVQLSFDFPFYGNPVRNVTVATGGFLYTGEYVHSWLAATQYIAPLMANFDTSLSDMSFVKYQDNGTAFTVVWEKVSLQDKPEVGTFTFSATLHKNGDIVFTYFNIPILIDAIQDDKHPVKVGLSDAYIIDKVIFFARRKTIYEYHRVTFASEEITNNTVIQLTALSTCLDYTDCVSCATHNTTFDCAWCPILNRCSTGTERKRQEWLHKGCDRAQISSEELCPPLGHKGNNAAQQPSTDSTETTESTHNSSLHPNSGDDSNVTKHVLPANKASVEMPEKAETHHVGVALGFIIPICLVMSALVWMLYAYRNPHTKSGQLLIQYRPSQWSWRRGEARYTAATIHM